jgi:hypothetical protein
MTSSIVQASCAVDVVVCDDTGTTDLTGLFAIGGLVVLVLVIAVIVVALRGVRRH